MFIKPSSASWEENPLRVLGFGVEFSRLALPVEELHQHVMAVGRALVKLYHTDRYAGDPKIVSRYTTAWNAIKDEADFVRALEQFEKEENGFPRQVASLSLELRRLRQELRDRTDALDEATARLQSFAVQEKSVSSRARRAFVLRLLGYSPAGLEMLAIRRTSVKFLAMIAFACTWRGVRYQDFPADQLEFGDRMRDITRLFGTSYPEGLDRPFSRSVLNAAIGHLEDSKAARAYGVRRLLPPPAPEGSAIPPQTLNFTVRPVELQLTNGSIRVGPRRYVVLGSLSFAEVAREAHHDATSGRFWLSPEALDNLAPVLIRGHALVAAPFVASLQRGPRASFDRWVDSIEKSAALEGIVIGAVL